MQLSPAGGLLNADADTLASLQDTVCAAALQQQEPACQHRTRMPGHLQCSMLPGGLSAVPVAELPRVPANPLSTVPPVTSKAPATSAPPATGFTPTTPGTLLANQNLPQVSAAAAWAKRTRHCHPSCLHPALPTSLQPAAWFRARVSLL